MSDNVTLNAGTGGDVAAADDIGGVKYQRVKVTLGADGVNGGDVASGNPMPVSAATLPLPSGAATAANQSTANTSLSNIDGKLPTLATGRVPVDGSGVTQPVSAASLPLPSGAATAANQATAVASLASIDAKVTAVNTGAVVVASSALPTGAATAAKQPALGTAGTASSDVLTVQGIASMTALKVDGSAVTQPVSAAGLPLPSGAATSAKQDTEIASLASIDGKVPSLGQALAAASVPVVLPAAQITTLTPPAAITGFLTEADFDTKVGGLTETAPASDTASSGVNGRLQRIAQRITSLIALFPSSLGAGGGLKVDGSGTALPVSGTVTANAGTGTMAVSLASVPSHAVTNAGTFAVQATLQAGTALAGQVSASPETSTVYNGTTALTPKFATIAASSSGDNSLVAAVTSKKIRVLAYNFIANGTVNAKFRNDTSGTPSDLTGLKYCVANMGICAPFNPAGWFETASGKNLGVNLSAGVAIGGELVYIEV